MYLDLDRASGIVVMFFLALPFVFAGLLMIMEPARCLIRLSRFTSELGRFELFGSLPGEDPIQDHELIQISAGQRIAMRFFGLAIALSGLVQLARAVAKILAR